MLPDLKACAPATREFAGSIKLLGALLAHHVKEEERGIFAVIRELFTAQELAAIDEQTAAWKRSAVGGPVSMHARIRTGVAAIFRAPGTPR